MKSMFAKPLALGFAALLMATLPAQAATTTPEAPLSLPQVNPKAVKGDIKIEGSSTVYVAAKRVVDKFTANGYADKLTMVDTGTGEGIELLCKGEVDIANASRGMREGELEACKANNVDPIQFKVGTDAIVVAVSRQNRFVDGLTVEQLGAIFSGKARTWNDVNKAWPAKPIDLYGRSPEHGSYGFLTDKLYEDTVEDEAEREKIIASVPGIHLIDDYNVVARALYNGGVFTIGYFNYAFYTKNRLRLRAVPINGIMANDRTIYGGTYEFGRPLYIITTAKIMKERPQVSAYVNYFLTNVTPIMSEVGYFAETNTSLNESKRLWLKATQ